MSESPDERKAHLGCFLLTFLIGFVQMRVMISQESIFPHIPWFVWAGGAVISPFLIALQIEETRRSTHPAGEFAFFAITSGGIGWSLGQAAAALKHSLSGPPRWDLVAFCTVLGLIIALGWRIAAGGKVLAPREENPEGPLR